LGGGHRAALTPETAQKTRKIIGTVDYSPPAACQDATQRVEADENDRDAVDMSVEVRIPNQESKLRQPRQMFNVQRSTRYCTGFAGVAFYLRHSQFLRWQ
jgi:hypothetical protein